MISDRGDDLGLAAHCAGTATSTIRQRWDTLVAVVRGAAHHLSKFAWSVRWEAVSGRGRMRRFFAYFYRKIPPSTLL